MNAKVLDIVVNSILKKLESGEIPWNRPYNPLNAVNYNSGRPYTGINSLLLDSGEYITFNKIKELDGKLKKGSKSSIVVFWKQQQIKDKKDDKNDYIEEQEQEADDKQKKAYYTISSYYKVFNIEDVDGLESKRLGDNTNTLNIDKVLVNYENMPTIIYNKKAEPYYDSATDTVYMLTADRFIDPALYYKTLFKLMVKSTGHPSRLSRKYYNGVQNRSTKAVEEIISEIGACQLCKLANVDTVNDSSAYISHWKEVINANKTEIVLAGQLSSKALDMILGLEN